MTTLSGLLTPFQAVGSSTRVNTAQLVNNNGRANVRFKSWLEEYLKQQEEAAAEEEQEAAYEAQKQVYKKNADFVFEPDVMYGDNYLYELDGVDPSGDMYVDMSGVSPDYNWSVWTGSGDDIVYMGDNNPTPSFTSDPGFLADGTLLFDNTHAGAGSDKIFAGNGSQWASGGAGDDLMDLGDGFDVASGGLGADEVVINLQNSGADLLTDFLDVGDKITIYHGAKLAEADDWLLVSVGSEWSGPPQSNNPNFAGVHQMGHDFYEIQNANGVTAAIFSAGTKIAAGESGGYYQGPQYQLTIEQGASSLEVVESHQDDASVSSVLFI